MSKHGDCSSSYVINENMCFELMMPKLHFTASCLTGFGMTMQSRGSAVSVAAKHHWQNVRV